MVVNNPNNWHWVDKNCIDWSRNYFNENLVGLSGEADDKEARIEQVSSVEGDVEVCQRKGKVISLFDLKLVLTIEGYAESATNKTLPFSGSITVPELAYDSESDDLQFDISIYNEDSQLEKVKPAIRSQLIPKLRLALVKFGPDLIKTHSSDIQLSSDKVDSSFTKANQEISTTKVVSSNNLSASASKSGGGAAAAAAASAAAATSKSTSTGSFKTETSVSVPKYNTSTMHLEPTFNATAEKLYVTLLDRDRIGAWTRSQPKLDAFPPTEGSTFELFGGSISGSFTKLEPNQRIVQSWRLNDWKQGHFARLDINLVQGAGETKMVVKWDGIPVGEEDRVRANFEDYYVRSIKITFGFGAVL